MAVHASVARASKCQRYGEKSHDHPSGSPAETVSITTRFPTARFSFEHDFSSLNQIKPVGRITFEKDDLARVELRRHCAKREQLKMMSTHSLEEGVSSQSPFNIRIADRERFAS